MKATTTSSLLILIFSLFCSIPDLRAEDEGDGAGFDSIWSCSDGRTYGLNAEGNKRTLSLVTGLAPVFFSGVKKGATYVGTVFVGGDGVAVSGPISNGDKRVTLTAKDGRVGTLNLSSK